MGERFRWHFTDENSERPGFPQQGPRDRRTRRGSRLRFIFTTLAAGLAVGFALVMAAQDRVDEVQTELQTDLLQTHRLMLEAAWSGDMELYATVLSREHLQWHSDQRTLLRRGQLFDRSALRLWLDHESALTALGTDTMTITSELSPDLQSALVLTTLPYLTGGEDDGYLQVYLVHRSHYQLEGGAWKLQPLPSRFPIGVPISVAAPLIATASVTGSEGYRPQRLVQEVLQTVNHLCADASCPPLSSYKLNFSNDPRAFASFYETIHVDRRRYRPRNGADILLPGPDLVGFPVDDSGYQALLKGYASWLGTFFLIQYSGEETTSLREISQILATHSLQLPSVIGFHPQAAAAKPPIPYPERTLHLLCSAEKDTRALRFDPRTGEFEADSDRVEDGVMPLNQIQNQATVQCSIPLCTHFIGDAQALPSPLGNWIIVQSAQGMPWRLIADDGHIWREFDADLHSPAWIDDQTLLFLGQESNADSGATTGGAGTQIPLLRVFEWAEGSGFNDTAVIDQGKLLEAMPPGRRPSQAHVEQYALDRTDPDNLFLFAATGAMHEALQFKLNVRDGHVQFLNRWIDNGYIEMPLEVAPDGQSLAMTRYNRSRSYLSVLNIKSGLRHSFALSGRPEDRFAWSDDGRWLAVADEQLLWLVVPEMDFQQPVEHNYAGCTAVTWD